MIQPTDTNAIVSVLQNQRNMALNDVAILAAENSTLTKRNAELDARVKELEGKANEAATANNTTGSAQSPETTVGQG